MLRLVLFFHNNLHNKQNNKQNNSHACKLVTK